MKNRPVTVLMPVFNAERYLKDAILSILNQTLSDFKLLIINDGSTDGSRKIIDEIKDDRIEVIDLPVNGGLVNALNVGLDTVDSKYIARADADDINLPLRLELQFEFMEKHPNVGALGTGFDSLLPNGEQKKGGRFSADHQTIRLRHLYQIQIIHGTSMLRTEVLKTHGLKFNPEFKHAEDYDFFDRLGNVSQIANLQEPLYLIRHHDDRVSSQFSAMQQANSNTVKFRIFKQIGLDINDSELEMFQWMMYQNYGFFSFESTLDLVNLINRIIEANNKTSYFEPEFLRSELCVRMLHLFSFLTKHDARFSSFPKKLEYLRFSDHPKLIMSILVKSILAKFRSRAN